MDAVCTRDGRSKTQKALSNEGGHSGAGLSFLRNESGTAPGRLPEGGKPLSWALKMGETSKEKRVGSCREKDSPRAEKHTRQWLEPSFLPPLSTRSLGHWVFARAALPFLQILAYLSTLPA
jgi:hypothetical protein